LYSSLQKIQGISIFQEKKKLTNTNRLDSKIQVLQLLTFKPLRQQKHIKDLSARELAHVFPPSHFVSWLENSPLTQVADLRGCPACPTTPRCFLSSERLKPDTVKYRKFSFNILYPKSQSRRTSNKAFISSC